MRPERVFYVIALVISSFLTACGPTNLSTEMLSVTPLKQVPLGNQSLPSTPVEVIDEIRKLLELPELTLEFVETTYMANSPNGSLPVENYRDSEGRIFSVYPVTNQVVEIDARKILEAISPGAPSLSSNDIEARAMNYARTVIPNFDSLQSSLQYEPGGKVDNYFFTWYRDISPAEFIRPFLQIAIHKSGLLFAYYNTLFIEPQ